jgi:ferric-dicitrate binding protein FerR (iron transport regulator)
MASERRAQALLRALADEGVPPEDDDAAEERRRRRVVEATALAIARAANERAARRRWARGAVALASAAAILAVVGVGWRLRTGSPVAGDRAGAVAVGEPIVGPLHWSHQGAPVGPGEPLRHLPLGSGDDVATEPGGRGEVVLADGVAITLESDTQVSLPDSATGATAGTGGSANGREVVRLARGVVSVRVPPMSPGHTFSIATPDAEVTVHGTSFTVEVVRPAGAGSAATSSTADPATKVRVTSGVVSVSSSRGGEAVLTAGMEWSSPVEANGAALHAPPPMPPASATTSSASAANPASKMASAPPHPASVRHDGTSPPRSRLGEENQLLASAIAVSKGGDYAGAVATLDDLLRRFPTSTLAQEAHVERFRALAHGDRSAAAREARLYLALYPDGFARDEAKDLAIAW